MDIWNLVVALKDNSAANKIVFNCTNSINFLNNNIYINRKQVPIESSIIVDYLKEPFAGPFSKHIGCVLNILGKGTRANTGPNSCAQCQYQYLCREKSMIEVRFQAVWYREPVFAIFPFSSGIKYGNLKVIMSIFKELRGIIFCHPQILSLRNSYILSID